MAVSSSRSNNGRNLQTTTTTASSNDNDNNKVWGIQSGPANGHTDAGGMYYDYDRDVLVLAGTTHDTQFFPASAAIGVDCFVATIALPPPFLEVSRFPGEEQLELSESQAEKDHANWKFSAKHRMTTPTALDRCDMISNIKVNLPQFGEQQGQGTSTSVEHDHTFVVGTMAIELDNNRDPTSVEPLIYEARVKYFHDLKPGTAVANSTTDESMSTSAVTVTTSTTSVVSSDDTTIETGPPLTLYRDEETTGSTTSGTQPKKNDIIIPAAMTSHHHDLYIATIHRLLVVSTASSTAEPMLRIALGVSKFSVMDGGASGGTVNNIGTLNILQAEWSRIYATSILEVKSTNGKAQPVTSGLFSGNPGMSPAEQTELEIEQNQIEEEIEQIEQEQEQYEQEEIQMDLQRHEYTHDGVLMSGLQVIETENPNDRYLLVAGSAPGVHGDGGPPKNNNSNNTGATATALAETIQSNHPFMDYAHTWVGDWDGYVAKMDARTGTILRPPQDQQSSPQNQIMNTWSFRLQTQPKRDDYIQSICVPKFPPGIMTNIAYYPSVAYVIGTTQGIVDGTQNGGAFILQLDLDTMNLLWKKQIPGMNVHGMACQVLIDTESHGTTTRSDSKDLLYIAGEVHGQMKVDVLVDPTKDDRKTRSVMTNARGETDVFVAQLQAKNGDVVWVQQIGTTQQDRLAKNINNPAVADGDQDSSIGETGSGAGALALDRHGNALVYGTTNGPLVRLDASPGNRNRDIFVVRLHRNDGSYQSILPPQATISTSPPAGGGMGSGSSATTTTPSSVTTSSSASSSTSSSEHNDVNWGIIALGLGLPVVLGVLIIAATSGGQGSESMPAPTPQAALAQQEQDLHVSFPSQSSSTPVPPEVERNSAPPHNTDQAAAPEHFNVF